MSIGTVKVITVSFTEDEIVDGEVPRHEYEHPREEEFEVDTIEEAVRVIEREGLTFAASGSDWAANPDGSVIVDYREGVREEATAHLSGFSAPDFEAIVARLG